MQKTSINKPSIQAFKSPKTKTVKKYQPLKQLLTLQITEDDQFSRGEGFLSFLKINDSGSPRIDNYGGSSNNNNNNNNNNSNHDNSRMNNQIQNKNQKSTSEQSGSAVELTTEDLPAAEVQGTEQQCNTQQADVFINQDFFKQLSLAFYAPSSNTDRKRYNSSYTNSDTKMRTERLRNLQSTHTQIDNTSRAEKEALQERTKMFEELFKKHQQCQKQQTKDLSSTNMRQKSTNTSQHKNAILNRQITQPTLKKLNKKDILQIFSTKNVNEKYKVQYKQPIFKRLPVQQQQTQPQFKNNFQVQKGSKSPILLLKLLSSQQNSKANLINRQESQKNVSAANNFLQSNSSSQLKSKQSASVRSPKSVLKPPLQGENFMQQDDNNKKSRKPGLYFGKNFIDSFRKLIKTCSVHSPKQTPKNKFNLPFQEKKVLPLPKYTFLQANQILSSSQQKHQ